MVEKKQLGKGGNDMTNKMMFTLEINKDSLIINLRIFSFVRYFFSNSGRMSGLHEK